MADRGGRQRLARKEAGTGRLVEAETRAKGNLKLSVYKKYWTEASLLVPLLVFCLFGLVQAIDAYNRYWLSYWTENKYNQGLAFYLGACQPGCRVCCWFLMGLRHGQFFGLVNNGPCFV